ncbi:MAG TPA: amino acid adenylation domain-containing protein, partial [Candidatus Eisenbacteria bacterium]|nr:amino acid adenylation domain-containing protein [Candidatus Eisenbacteria bacterium]
MWEQLGRVREEALGAYEHQELPFERLVEALRPRRDLARHPLFQVMFQLQNAPHAPLRLRGLQVEHVPAGTGTSKFDLGLLLAERPDGGLDGWLEYATALFERATVRRWLGHWLTLLEGMVADPGASVWELPLLTPDERRAAREAGRGRRAPPAPDVVHAVWTQPAGRPAVAWPGGELTYGTLRARAGWVTRRLAERGQGPESRVAVLVPRSPALVAALLGVLAAGAAYVPLDPEHPDERLRWILADAGVRLALADERGAARLAGGPAAVLRVEDAAEAPVAAPVPAPRAALAYVVYTSGSTGRPKGAMVTRGGLANLMAWYRSEVGGGARVLHYAALGFDMSVYEVLAALTSGGTLVLVPDAVRADPAGLRELLPALRVETAMLPVTVLRHLADVPERLGAAPLPRDVVSAGEQLRLDPALAGLFAAQPGRRLHNHYGPSETHVVTAHTLPPGPWPPVAPIGRPVANVDVHVLDRRLRPVPAGVAGELCVGGEAPGRGYLDRPGPTAERFVPDPFSPVPGRRLYRTGDLARRLPDGTLLFLGRRDHQVKVRGQRVELGEVEAVLAEHPAVRQAAVVARPDEAGDLRLSAYVTLEREAAAGELRDHAARRLPAHAVPVDLVPLAALPLNANGKVDRAALSGAAPAARAARAGRPPRTPAERRIAEIWASLLPAARIGADDDFFSLGGHSMLATMVLSRVRRAF